MVDGTAGSNGAGTQDDHGRAVAWSSADPHRWPVSAICCVAVLSVVVLLLLVMNVLGLHLLGGDGRYDPDTGGSVAEWFGAMATLVALPAAVLFGVRQLQSSGDAILLGQRQLEAGQAERDERRRVELAALHSSLRVAAEAANVVDAPELASEAEVGAVEAWRREYRQRGWVADAAGATWERDAVRRSNADQLTAEPGPLLPEPWFVAVSCRNAGAGAIHVARWTVIVDGVATTLDGPTELAPGEQVRHRLGPGAGAAGPVRVTEETWLGATEAQPHFAISETPIFVGRAVAALAQDPDRSRWNGSSLSSGQLAQVYGFTDADGSRPDAWRYLVEVQDPGKPADVTGYR